MEPIIGQNEAILLCDYEMTQLANFGRSQAKGGSIKEGEDGGERGSSMVRIVMMSELTQRREEKKSVL